MTRVKKVPFEGKGRGQVFVYDKFRLFEGAGNDVLFSRDSINCDCRDGALRAGIGIRPYQTPSKGNPVALEQASVSEVRSFRRLAEDGTAVVEQLGVTAGDGNFYLYAEDGATVLAKLSVGTRAGAVTALSVAEPTAARLIVSGELGTYVMKFDGTEQTALFEDTGRAICSCRNRVFVGGKGGVLYYSDPMTPWNFTESIDGAGKIRFLQDHGEIVALKRLGEDVYVFFERAILRMEVAGSAREFRLSTVPYNGCNIFGDSVGAAGEYLFFLATDGMYRTDGKTVKKICENLSIKPNRAGQVCDQAVFDGKYVLRYKETSNKMRQLVIDADGESGYFSTVREGLCENGGVALCRYQGMVYKVESDGLISTGDAARFHTVDMDFGNRGRKTLTKLRFEGEVGMRLLVECDGHSLQRTVAFSDGVAEVELCVRGEKFSFTFELYTGAVLRKMEAEVATAE